MTNDITKTIAAFPQPSNLSFNFARNWGPESMSFFGPAVDTYKGKTNANSGFLDKMEAIGSAIMNDGTWATIKEKFKAGLMGPSFEAAVQNAYGFAVNKRNAVIFQDLPFRDISLQWTLRPRNAKMAQEFLDAINKLKVQSAPKLESSGAVWDVSDCKFQLIIDPSQALKSVVPGISSLQALQEAKGKVLFQSWEMVITNIAVDYTPNGFWSQHMDGFPTQINLSISMMETELAYNQGGNTLKNVKGDEVI